MDSLPEELLLQIISLLDPKDIPSTQLINSRFRKIGRDNNIWKRICFQHSRAEEARRRQHLFGRQDANLVDLRQAIGASTEPWLRNLANDPDVSGAQTQLHEVGLQRTRAFTNWDPSYSSERVNFYHEYIHRHSSIFLTWLPKEKHVEGRPGLESIGMAIIDDPADIDSQKLLSPFEDGSIRVYDLGSLRAGGTRRVRLIAETSPGYLFGNGPANKAQTLIQNEVEFTDNVSIDSHQQKAYVANLDSVNELDLNTLQIIRRETFPFPVTALSAATHPLPLTVGTHQTLHLYDPRTAVSQLQSNLCPTTRCELIGGPPAYSKSSITLSQPGPLSILHSPSGLPSDNNIYIAGRFTSLLRYDRRFWPRIAGTIFSGARLSALAAIPYPYIPRSLDLIRNADASIPSLHAAKATPGATLIAAGEYKGKGSLELYGLGVNAEAATRAEDRTYRNRQTAAKSRLLSVTPHGTRIVFSDGDGNLKWVERDGGSAVRSFNINTDASTAVVQSEGDQAASCGEREHGATDAQGIRRRGGIFAVEGDDTESDIVRKIIPRVTGRLAQLQTDGYSMFRDDLLVQTGDGKLGIVGFGRRGSEDDEGSLHEAALSAEEAANQKQERAYGQRMRVALERSADEARWVRRLGL